MPAYEKTLNRPLHNDGSEYHLREIALSRMFPPSALDGDCASVMYNAPLLVALLTPRSLNSHRSFPNGEEFLAQMDSSYRSLQGDRRTNGLLSISLSKRSSPCRLNNESREFLILVSPSHQN
jgi:hypothetical protein